MQRLATYFETGDIGPTYRNKNGTHPFGRLGITMKEGYTETLGMAFVTASKISHLELQDIIFEKLKALFPLPVLGLLKLLVVYSSLPPPETQTEEDLGLWVVKHVVESHAELMKKHPDSFKRLLEENAELKSAVVGRLKEAVREENSGCQDEVVPARGRSAT
jgi:hypothetical protein